ncbi:helix-turn-helix domain-containing protein [Streptacidiphilus jiangxiensis]|uniref:Helix-turn-helix domain-containing protein n=1 Tax=Streptacidiphilus jiangxiensis TaxID=235985 RepID=A0A1H7Y9M6_STRJI|nr:XRE family transcriptional regulator [Streptacidiphilus jiangxiensis]SEM42601.1 Helix-turn-helix domain-containing protein [Streptacidiphilus jiangxiensis]
MGANWRPIPDDVRGHARRLTEELRGIKDRSGLSLTQIGARTHYSKASWERWFNGKRLITEQALESLAITVDESARLLKPLLELALSEEGAPADPAAPPTPSTAPAPATPAPATPAEVAPTRPASADDASPAPAAALQAGGWRRHLRTAAIAACSALVGGAVGAYLAAPSSSPTTQALGTHAPTPVVSPPPCAGVGCDGKDPQSTGCVKDERVLTTDHVGTIVIYLHYSPRCHAAWGGLTNAGPGDKATVFTTTGDQQTALVHWGYDNYSMMVDASDPSIGLKVCGTPAKKPNEGVCTLELSVPAGS